MGMAYATSEAISGQILGTAQTERVAALGERRPQQKLQANRTGEDLLAEQFADPG